MIEPRFSWVPPRARSLGPDAIAWWRDAGGTLFDWQEFEVDAILGLDENDLWSSSEDGFGVARQNGKGVVLQVVEGFCAFELGYPVVMHTAHEFATSQEHQFRLEDVIQNAPHLHAKVGRRGHSGYVHANGQESIHLKSGSRIIFKARTKMGARGYSGDLLVWDEAMVVPDTVVGSMLPMLRASRAVHGPKVIYSGSAVDQEVHEYGVNFARIRERGIANALKVSYNEWSAPFDHPSQLTEDLMRDRIYWPAANPSMEEGLVSEEYMADEVERMPSRTAAVELLGVGDWPRTDGLEDTVISIERWDELEDVKSVLQLDEPWCLAFDVSPDRRTSIAIAGRNQEGLFHVEVQECRPGTSWVVPRIAEMVENGNPEIVVCDAVGPAASLLVALKEEGVTVETVNSTEHGQAFGRFVDMVNDQTLRHLGSTELRDAIRGSKTRQLGDAQAWARRNSTVDISSLVASTLALGAAAGVAIGEIHIF